MNPLYTQNNFMQQFNMFKQQFRGDPQAQVQQLLNSGKVSQQQYNQAVQKANMLKQLFGIR